MLDHYPQIRVTFTLAKSLLDEPVLARTVLTLKEAMKAVDRRGDPDWPARLRASELGVRLTFACVTEEDAEEE